MKVGILCGHEMPDLVMNPEEITVETPFGAVVVHVSKIGDHELFFISRHGKNGTVPPHKINYRGNIHALASCHVSCIVSIGTVGSLNKAIQPGDLAIPHDFIDMTTSRTQTFFDDKRVHVDMTKPFCDSFRDILIQSCKKTRGIRFHEKGVYLVTEGPRLESAAEITFYSTVADLVGMTLCPEVVLAREKGLCFVSLVLVCNMAAGLQNRLTAYEITSMYKNKEPMMSKVLTTAFALLKEKQSCGCPGDISQAML